MAINQIKLQKLQAKRDETLKAFEIASKAKDESIAKGGHGEYTCDQTIWRQHWEARDAFELTNKNLRLYETADERKATAAVKKQAKLDKIEAKKNKIATKERKKQELFDQTFRAPIALCIEPMRKAAVEAAIESAKLDIESLIEELNECGWDLNKIAPYPERRMNRETSKQMRAQRVYIQSLTESANPNEYKSESTPWILKQSDKAEKMYIKGQAEQAEALYTAYIFKLTERIGECVEASVDSQALWYRSTLTIKRKDGSFENWKTQQIRNRSCLGTLFYQWPTRKVG